jgi:Predicted outer membrane protein
VVVDDGKGNLVADNGSALVQTAEFTNTYDAKGEAVLKAKKASNTKLGEKTFQFQLLDADDKVIETSTAVKQGETATFTTIEYELADLGGAASKDFTYKIREVIPEGATAENNYTVDGVKYDPKVVTTVVTVADAGDGTLIVKYDGNETFTTPEFKNEYDPKGEAVLKAKKASNAKLGDRTFRFQLLDAADKVIETSAAVKQGKTATFKTIKYTLADLGGATSKEFTYKIREVIPAEATAENDYTVDGVKYDTHVETVTVKVEDDGKGNLIVTYNGKTEFTTPEFKNSLTFGSLKIRKNVTVNGKKTTGKMADGTYTFIITGPNGYKNTVKIKIKNGVSSEVQLDNLVPGEYTVSEDTSKNPAGISLVGKNGKKVTVTAGGTTNIPTAEFTNNKKIESIKIPVEKRWVRTAGKSATIQLIADGHVIQEVVLSQANNWRYVFTGLPKYDSTDGHKIKYTVSEYPISGYIVTISGDAENGFVVTNTPSDTPPTGDQTNLSGYLWSTILSGLGLIGVLFAERKKARRKKSRND